MATSSLSRTNPTVNRGSKQRPAPAAVAVAAVALSAPSLPGWPGRFHDGAAPATARPGGRGRPAALEPRPRAPRPAPPGAAAPAAGGRGPDAAACPGALDTNDGQPFQARAADRRDARYALRDAAQHLAAGAGRVCVCGRRLAPGVTEVAVKRAASGRAFYSGLVSCGSVWTCAVCAMKVARERQGEVGRLLAAHLGAGGGALFLTLTVPHALHHGLRHLVDVVSSSWTRLWAGSAAGRVRERYGVTGYVRALEVTRGGAGWHPHLHALLFLDGALSDAQLQALHADLFGRWAHHVSRAGLGSALPECAPLTRVYSTDAATYATKISAAAEVTRVDAKSGRGVSRTPFQVLADFAADGRREDAALWSEWCHAMHRVRQLTYSTGLRARYAEPERTDEEIAATEVEGEEVVAMNRAAWRYVCSVPHLRADLLRAVERDGLEGVLELVDSLPYWPDDGALFVRSGPVALLAA